MPGRDDVKPVTFQLTSGVGPFRGIITMSGGADPREALWWSEGLPPPLTATIADDRTTADLALRRARSGEALAFTGDWHNGRQLLSAMGRRIRTPRPREPGLRGLFGAERARRRVEHELLGRLAVPVDPGWICPLRRAPPLQPALSEAFGDSPEQRALLPLREILGAIGAHEWRRRGVYVPAIEDRVIPHYGVFAPVRGEYVELVAEATRRRSRQDVTVFDVGTGTGVLAVVLARAGARIVASDSDPRAVACARENAERLRLADRIEVSQIDLFPPGRAELVVMNPPWIPAEPHGPLDRAVYDPGGTVLSRFLAGSPAHLAPGGEAWLVLSDLAERLGLRDAGAIEAMARAAGLRIVFTLETRPSHRRARDAKDPLAAARSEERTRLYALAPMSDG